MFLRWLKSDGIGPVRPGFDRKSRVCRVFLRPYQFEVGIVIGFSGGLRKQLEKERDFKWWS